LQVQGGERAQAAQTDSQGNYRFEGLSAGTYTLRGKMGASGESVAGPFALGPREVRKVDLTLQSAPEFFDEPRFIVAGVTDGASHGGHGSDTILRSTEALSKATASLSHVEDNKENALETVRRYQRAAEADPSESNLFDWGAELLKHRADEPARQVFAKGHRLFPQSSRMLLGLAVSFYASGSYDLAASRFFEACDLNPSDPGPYLFLAKVRSTVITQADGFSERMGRFASLQPENALAVYYYGVSLWNQRKSPDDQGLAARARSLLERAVRLDPGLGVAHLQLGIIHAERKDYPAAIAAYEAAVEKSPELEEAHYRLGQSYLRTGEKSKAQKELELYSELSKKSALEAERERAEIQRFVVTLQSQAPVR
jgi:tetratricopeptide (TPR) repeat protein